MELNHYTFMKHSAAVHTNRDWRERARKADDRYTLSIYRDEQEEREEVPVQVTLHQGAPRKRRGGILPEVQADVRV